MSAIPRPSACARLPFIKVDLFQARVAEASVKTPYEAWMLLTRTTHYMFDRAHQLFDRLN